VISVLRGYLDQELDVSFREIDSKTAGLVKQDKKNIGTEQAMCEEISV
jgi:hypothetical protein